jgi:hypothetical protein
MTAFWNRMGELAPIREQNLFHYTDLAGFHGIVQQTAIWATNVFHLNDYGEIMYGLRKFKAELDARVATLPPRAAEMFANIYAELTAPHEFHPFVFSLCRVDDLLSQWRGYTHGGPGMELAFSVSGLIEEHWGAFYLQVEYDPARIAERYQQYLAIYWRAITDAVGCEGSGDETARAVTMVHTTAKTSLNAILAAAKNERFAEEREFRIVAHRVPSAEDVLYRIRANELVPYVALQPRSKDNSTAARLPLVGVRLGPAYPNAVTAAGTISRFLERYGYRNVPVLLSDVTHRSPR